MIFVFIAIGGAVGSIFRYLMGSAVQRLAGGGFPYGTLAVNTLGCFIIGVLVELFINLEPPAALRALLVVGFCGGFTTFSTFSNETVGLYEAGAYWKALIYAVGSVSLCLASTSLGIALMRASGIGAGRG